MRLLPGYVLFPGASRKCQTIGLKVAAALLPSFLPCILADCNIIAVERMPRILSLEYNGRRSPFAFPSPPIAPPHFPVAYLRNGQQRNNYLRPFYFAKIDFLIPLFTAECHCEKPARLAAIQSGPPRPGKGLNAAAGVKIRVGEHA